ncbi:MAG: hypothetical protein FJ387_28955 [Verrucomicrobia bacterium]|nr:hypothetical protein [Verrucomicrobiota bacterium]
MNIAQALQHRFGKLLFLSGACAVGLAQSVELDPSFKPAITTTAETGLLSTALQPDGKVIVAGTFDLAQGVPGAGVARLHPDGSVDTTFEVGGGVFGNVYGLAIQGDSRILIAGDFVEVDGVPRVGLARLEAQGGLDAAFEVPVGGADVVLTAVRLQPDGKVLIGGAFDEVHGVARRGVARLNADGSLDRSFDPGTGVGNQLGYVNDLALYADGGVLVAGFFTEFNGVPAGGLVRLRSNGSVDPGFIALLDSGAGLPEVMVARVQSDGKALIAGFFDTVDFLSRPGLARLSGDGSLDEGFDPLGGFTGISPAIHDMVPLANGTTLVAGDFDNLHGVPLNGLARLRSDGMADGGFDPGRGLEWSDGSQTWGNALALQPDGKILVAGVFQRANGVPRHHLARLQPSGALDSGFSHGDAWFEMVDSISAVVAQPDGRWVVGGRFERANGSWRNHLARFHPDGSLDLGFDQIFSPDGWINALVLEPDGKVLVGGAFDQVGTLAQPNLARLQSDGTVDEGFLVGQGPDGEVYTIARQTDGKIVVGGDFAQLNGIARSRLGRLQPNGTLDQTFQPVLAYQADPSIVHEAYTIVVQPDGKLLVGGFFDRVNNQARSHLTRLNADGTLDSGFAANLQFTGEFPFVTALGLEPDGKILVGGSFERVNGQARRGIARLLANGTLDLSFAPSDGVAGGDFPALYTMRLLPDGRVLVGGEFTQFNGAPRQNLALIGPTGQLDGGMDPVLGTDFAVNALAIRGAGPVLVGGVFTRLGGQPRQALAQLNLLQGAPGPLAIRREGAQAVITWAGAGRLQSAPTLLGMWTDVAGATSPHSVAPTAQATFYRLAQ